LQRSLLQLLPNLPLLQLRHPLALAVAQRSRKFPLVSVTDCADDSSILDACKGTIQGQINSCGTNDWGCLCTQYINL
jgi:hypothetical protein